MGKIGGVDCEEEEEAEVKERWRGRCGEVEEDGLVGVNLWNWSAGGGATPSNISAFSLMAHEKKKEEFQKIGKATMR
ncbi:hypothetical protein LINGRAHAP2_LOCUS32056 [Linum grandiflorum]